MIAARFSTLPPASRRRGLTLVEMAFSIPLVGIALVAALNTVAASKLADSNVSVSRDGHLLAQQLMAEILEQDYVDITLSQTVRDDILATGSATYALGPDIYAGRDEVATKNRSLFNDVDDYDGWRASPPESKDGQFTTPGGWDRSASVVTVLESDFYAKPATDSGFKRITVTVTHGDLPIITLVALKTFGLPWLEACCFADGTCEDLRAEDCTLAKGTAKGPESKCANTACPAGPIVLFVVTNSATPTVQEVARQTLLESWGYRVQRISASALESEFRTAAGKVDVAYISVEIVASDLGGKLKDATIGVVNAQPLAMVDFRMWSPGTAFYVFRTGEKVIDNTHFITSPLALGPVTLSTSSQWFVEVVSGLPPGAQVLTTLEPTRASLFIVEIGAPLVGGIPSPARRVELPWGKDTFDVNALTADAQTILKRSLIWAAGMDAVCGDGFCATSERCTCPADCGLSTIAEKPGLTCSDGLDNDCDGKVDCADADCAVDATCVIVVCGNGICELDEHCNNCPADCSSVSGGTKKLRYCCGNGIVETAEGDGTICDGNY